jgi:Tfp pilus assembly protein PilN
MKLNLVPDYVRQRKVNKQIVALMVVLFVVVNAAMVFWMLQTNRRLAELQEEKSTLEMQAQQVDSLVQQAQGKISQAAITLAKSEFVKMVQRQNLRYPELYSEVARYTAPRVRYVQLQVAQGNQLQVTAFAKGPKEIGLYLQTMYQCPLFSAVNLTTQTPGYATGGGGATGALPGLGLGFGGGVPPGPTVGGLAGAAGGAPSLSGFQPFTRFRRRWDSGSGRLACRTYAVSGGRHSERAYHPAATTCPAEYRWWHRWSGWRRLRWRRLWWWLRCRSCARTCGGSGRARWRCRTLKE